MDYTNLGRTGLKVSRLCLGTGNFGSETDERESHIFGGTDNGTSLWRAYAAVKDTWPNFQMSRIAKAADAASGGSGYAVLIVVVRQIDVSGD